MKSLTNWIRKYYLSLLGYSLIFLFLFFYIFNIFAGKKSLFDFFKLEHQIVNLEKELNLLKEKELEISKKIGLLKNNSLDPDLVSEIAQEKLGLIHQGRVIIKVD